jgi:hypothetical protein
MPDDHEPKVRFACPVCGYRGLWQPPYEHMPVTPYPDFGDAPYAAKLGSASLEGCHGCGYQFGYDDDPAASGRAVSFHDYRSDWIKGGCRWWSGKPQPAHWDPKSQMHAAGIRFQKNF